MALRLVEIFLPSQKAGNLFDIVDEFPSATVVQKEDEDGQLHVKLLMEAANTDLLMDKLEGTFLHHPEYRDNFRVLITPVQATIPRIQPPQEDAGARELVSKHKIKHARVSREELYTNIHEASRLSWLFVLMVAFATIVAAIGLLRNNTAVVIGAMVIAPLLGPNVALALASALGDKDLAKSARRANMAGICVPFLLAAAIGIFYNGQADGMEIISRTDISLSDIILALITGCIATLSFTMAMGGTLIGVMVAVALLPPLAASGILLGTGQWKLAIDAGLLFLTNLICVNLAGVLTFLVQGVQPLWWWDKEKAQRATRRALITWLICLILLVLSIIASQRWIK